jgi:hypothetical protein
MMNNCPCWQVQGRAMVPPSYPMPGAQKNRCLFQGSGSLLSYGAWHHLLSY